MIIGFTATMDTRNNKKMILLIVYDIWHIANNKDKMISLQLVFDKSI